MKQTPICSIYIPRNSYIDSVVYRKGFPNENTKPPKDNNIVGFAVVGIAKVG